MITYKYRALMPSGHLEEFRCASIFTPTDVRNRMGRWRVFLYVSKRQYCLGKTDREDGFIKGPCWVWLVGGSIGAIRCPETPNEKNAWDMIRLMFDNGISG